MRLAHERRRGLFFKLLGASPLIGALRFLWVVLVIWYELGTFFWSVSGCRWPDKPLRDSGSTDKSTHVLLVSDPQVLDHRSYPGRSGWVTLLTQVVVDLNIRKNWLVATRFRPHVVVFLGDMMDNGRYASSDAEYAAYYERLKSIFALDPSTTVYYIPGNHDVGLGTSSYFSPRSRQRYVARFGPLNQRVSVANHTFVLIDAPGLVEEDYQRAATGLSFDNWNAPHTGTVEFIRKFASEGSEEPVILFSHIPLFRPDTATCGPLRERGSIHRGVGYGYQNTLGKDTTKYLLDSIRPSLVFSGDDHDYCEYIHSLTLVEEGPEPIVEHVKEVTVKAFSMAMGIRRPGFQLLSLVPPSPVSDAATHPTFADAPCFLPNQLAIYLSRYVPLAVLTTLVLAIYSWKSHRTVRKVPPGDLDLELTPPSNDGKDPVYGHQHRASIGRGGHARADSAVWQVLSPGLPATPLAQLGSTRTLRTPLLNGGDAYANGNGSATHSASFGVPPSYRASRPSTPLDSPSLRPMPIPLPVGMLGRGLDEGDDEDPLAPAQYAYRASPYLSRSHSHSRSLSHHHPGDEPFPEDISDDAGSYFLLTSGRALPALHRRQHWAWSASCTFVFRGRRRRMTCGVPASWLVFFSFLPGLEKWKHYAPLRGSSRISAKGRRRGVVRVFLGNMFAVAWPALLTFVFISTLLLW